MPPYYPAQALLVKTIQVHVVGFLQMIFTGIHEIVNVTGIVQVPEQIAIRKPHQVE
jgi:hypothetical protein